MDRLQKSQSVASNIHCLHEIVTHTSLRENKKGRVHTEDNPLYEVCDALYSTRGMNTFCVFFVVCFKKAYWQYRISQKIKYLYSNTDTVSFLHVDAGSSFTSPLP